MSLVTPKNLKASRKTDTTASKTDRLPKKTDYSEGMQRWHYLYEANALPTSVGWTTIINTPGDSQESIIDSTFRTQAFGTVGRNMRLSYTYAHPIPFDFSQGLTMEWRGKFNLTKNVTGTPQANIYIGDNDETIRVLYNGLTNSISLLWSTSSRYTDSATNMANWHIYKLVILGSSASYYVDDSLIATISKGNSGAQTNYIRIDNRNDAPATFDCYLDYIRVLIGNDTSSRFFTRKLT